MIVCNNGLLQGCAKKLTSLLRENEECEDVGKWRQSISNYMYWCTASTLDGDGQLIQEKWKILPFHIQNIHANGSSQLYPVWTWRARRGFQESSLAGTRYQHILVLGTYIELKENLLYTWSVGKQALAML